MTGPLIDAAATLADDAGMLGVLLAHWGDRGDAANKAAAVRAGHSAVDTIDAMLRTLYGARAVLVGEIRTDQDERADRVDAVLAGRRGDGR